MIDENWVKFTQTGSINDYLKYKENENYLKAEENANNYQGTCNKGTEYRGE